MSRVTAAVAASMIACLGVVGPFGASAAAGSTPVPESRQLYFASGPDYAIAFEVEGAKVSVLGLDATVYCEDLEPLENQAEHLDAFFPLPTPLKEGRRGLVAVEGESDDLGSDLTSVQASVEDGRIVGKFKHDLSLGSSHCQTGGYYAARPAVPFEATRYVPVSSPEASAPAPGTTRPADSGVYFLREGRLETYLVAASGHVFIRGEVSSKCRFQGRRGGLDPLFPSPIDPAIGDAGEFAYRHRYRGVIRKGSRFSEPISLAGVLGEDSITATYSRSVSGRFGKERTRCAVGPQTLEVPRYVPAAG